MIVITDSKGNYYTGEKTRSKRGRRAIMSAEISDAMPYKSMLLANKAAQSLNELEGREEYRIITRQLI